MRSPSSQATLFVLRAESLQEQFESFHEQNPDVYRTLVRLARQMQAKGKRVGIGCLWEVARYFVTLETEGDAFKLNNNHRSRYAREIMRREPDLRGYFETRELRS